MQKDVENFRNEFCLEKPTHLAFNNAGLSLMTKRCAKRLNDLTERMTTEGCYREPYYTEFVGAKETLARFIDADVGEVAWTPNCSSAISMVANGYEHAANEEIVVFQNEYPSNFYPWVSRSKCKGSKLVVVPVEKNLTRKVEAVLSSINSKTRIVAFSHAQSDCGYLMDIARVAEAAHKVGAIVVVDAIQTMGVVPLSLRTSGADIICSGSHKWLCGPLGAGVLAVKKHLLHKISPCLHGALNYGTFEDASCVERNPHEDSRKFEQGTPSFHGVFGAAASMEVIMEYGVDNLRKKTMKSRNVLEGELRELGFNVLGDSLASGPQISVLHAKKTVRDISQVLETEKISHALRPAPVEGGKVLRLSPHAYNTGEELNRVTRALKKALA